jgi:hypothetical protein
MVQYQMKLAKFFSLIGHPLFIGPIYVVLVSFNNLSYETAWRVSLLTVGIIALPIIVHNLRKFKKGEYSNFDVSDQNQRKNFYPFAIFLLTILTLTFYILDFPLPVTANTLNFLAMILIMAFLNLKIKASLHASVAFYVCVSLICFSTWLGLIFLLLAVGATWSRSVLNRHTNPELIVGVTVGIVFGLVSLYY